MNEGLRTYRTQLIEFEQEAQKEYDKTVLALSGGALGVSITFLRDIVPPGDVVSQNLLLLAWTSWTISVTLALASHFLGQLALRKAIDQVDKSTIHEARPGGAYDVATLILNFLAGVLFIVGAGLMIPFVLQNMGV